MVLQLQVIGGQLSDAVCAEDELWAQRRSPAISERKVDIQLVHPFAAIFLTVRYGSEQGNAGRHDGDLRNRRCKIELAHGVVSLVVSFCNQSP